MTSYVSIVLQVQDLGSSESEFVFMCFTLVWRERGLFYKDPPLLFTRCFCFSFSIWLLFHASLHCHFSLSWELFSSLLFQHLGKVFHCSWETERASSKFGFVVCCKVFHYYEIMKCIYLIFPYRKQNCSSSDLFPHSPPALLSSDNNFTSPLLSSPSFIQAIHSAFWLSSSPLFSTIQITTFIPHSCLFCFILLIFFPPSLCAKGQ